MSRERGETPGTDAQGPPDAARLPRPVTSGVLAGLMLVVIAGSAWLATRPGAGDAQAGVVTWLNHPPQPLAAVLAVTNPFFRPLSLTVVAVVLVGWVLLTAGSAWARREVLRATLAGLVLAEAMAQILKRSGHQPRPSAAIPGLDMHGYPKDPLGYAYPSAHTAVAVALVSALWPWMSRPQRIAGVAVAVLIALNRIYIGAHWPLDVVGGAAIGLLSGSICWLVAAWWPIPPQRGGV